MTLRRLAPLALAAVLLAACGSSGAVTSASTGLTMVATTSTIAGGTGATPTDVTTPRPPDPPRVADPAERAAFDAARARWRATAASHYTMRIRYTCFCARHGLWTVTVRDGALATASPIEPRSGPASGLSATFEGVGTVEELFDQLDRALGGADDVSVTYDEASGYPSAASIDWIARAVDEELAWTIESVAFDRA